MTHDLSPALTAVAATQDGVFTRAQALSSGLSRDEFERAVYRGQWHRIRRGAYVAAELWTDARPPDRQRLGLRAMTLLVPGHAVGSHDTAAAVLGLEVWEPDYDWIHLTRPGHSGRREAGVWHHNAGLEQRETTSVAGLIVTDAVRTALDIARRSDFEHGLVAVDSALRLSGTSVEQLRKAHLRCIDWAGARAAGRAVSHADERAASVGESRLRAMLTGAGLPEPLTQVSVYNTIRQLEGVVDFLLGDKVILEFDGRVKYGLKGMTPEALSAELWREKLREDALRDLGYEVVRVTWADLYHPERIVSRIRAALARAAVSPPIRGTHRVEPQRHAAAS